MSLKTVVLAVTLFAPGGTQPTDCDVAVLSGRVTDPETEFDAVRNVCVKDGRIADFPPMQAGGSFNLDAALSPRSRNHMPGLSSDPCGQSILTNGNWRNERSAGTGSFVE